MSNYEIQLGVKLDTGSIASQINEAEKKVDPIKIKIDAETKELTSTIKDALKSLTTGTKNALTLDTTKLESSLNDVKSTIVDIKNVLGTLDSGKGMKSLVSSINSISTALDKASSKFDELAGDLKSLSGKDFNLNFGITMGKSNSVERQGMYGSHVRRTALPELKKQAEELNKYLKEYYKVNDEYNAILNMTRKTGNHKIGGEVQDLYTVMAGYKLKGGEASLREQMDAYARYIDIIKEYSSLNNIDVSHITSQFSKSADQLIQDAQDIQTGAKEMDESFDKLKQIFGGGANINGDALSAQLESIVADLGEIKTAIKDLSSGTSIDGLTQSFNRLSDTLDKLVSNFDIVKNAINSDLTNVGNITSTADKIKQESDASTASIIKNEERKQQAYRETANESEIASQQVKHANNIISDSANKSIDNVTSKKIGKYFEIDKSDSNAFKTEMNNLVKKWTNNKGNLVDVKISTKTSFDKDVGENIERLHQAQVTYNNELGETIKKTIAWRKIGSEIDPDGKESPIYGFAEASSQYSKSINNTASKTQSFVKQQKTAVSDLTNQINQLNRAANDQNASKAIKDSSHLESLGDKYDEVISAIYRMGNASDSNTFIDERNNVKRLISEYQSLVSEYKNAENVATSLRSKDIDTVKDTYSSKLDVLISKMRKDGVYTSGFESGAENLRSILGNATDASGLVKFLNGLDKLEAGYKRASASAKEFNQAQKVRINVSGLESKITDLQRINPEINQFEAEIDGAKVTVQSLFNDLKQVNTQSDFSVVNAKWKAFENAAKAAGITISETAKNIKLVDDIKLDISLGNYDNELDALKYKTDSLSDDNFGWANSLKQVENAYEKMLSAAKANTGNLEADRENLIQAEKEYAEALERTSNLIKQQSRLEAKDARNQKLKDDRDIFKAKIDAWLETNSAATKKFGATMLDLKAKAESCDRVTLNHLEKQFTKVDKAAEKSGLKMRNFGDRIKDQIKQYSAYLSVAEVFMYITQALKNMFDQVKAIDTAMTELKKVTNETDASYNNFLNNAASRAKEIGTTIDGLVTSTADFARLGYDFADAQGLAEVANIYAVVGDDIDSVETATQSLISTLTAFKDEANGLSDSDFALSIVDKMNEVSNNFAISSGGIGEALQRSASSMMAANNSLDETIALITAANTVVQDPDAVGRLMPTIKVAISVKLQRWTRPR